MVQKLLWPLQITDRRHEIGVCSGSKTASPFCKICLPDLAQEYIHYSSNNDSINCSEISSAVTWFRHRSSLLQIPFQIPLFRNSLHSNQQKQKHTGQNISSQTHSTFTFLNKSETVLLLKEFLLLMLRYEWIFLEIQTFLFGAELLIFQKNL